MATCLAVAYTFDDIKGTVTLLVALYGDVNAAEITVPGKPVVSERLLQVLGTLRKPLIDDDQRRFDLVVEKLIETRLNARTTMAAKGSG